MTVRTFAAALLCAAALPGSALAQGAPPPAAAKAVIRAASDLPRHDYPVPTTLMALFDSDDATFNAFADRVAADADAVLANYVVEDPATRRMLLSIRLAAQMLNGRNREALETSAAIRALEQKPDAKLTSGARENAVLAARLETGATSGPAYEDAFARAYRAALVDLPFAVVGNRLKEGKSSFEVNSPAAFRGIILNDFEPEVAKRHAVGDDGAQFLIRARLSEKIYWPLRSRGAAVLKSIITANTVVKPDIWAAREVTFAPAHRLTPVTVAVWDTGVDMALFPGLAYRAAARPARGPGNGYGISFDEESRPTGGILRPLDARQKAAYRAMLPDMQGLNDLQAALDTPDAEQLRAKMASMTPQQSKQFIEDLDLFGDYTHGTHVAGILARGNPAVRLAVVRETFYDGPFPPPPTDATVTREVEHMRDVSRWLKANKVRVVNMSWIGTPLAYERGLEQHGIGKDAAERKAMAARFFARTRGAFVELLADNPATLFVSAAGNSNSDNGFEGGYPSSVVAPNLIIANAVDQAGEETSFTSNGSNVVVSSNGYQVVSKVPGGREIAMSGTSMAAPNVANLAAKLLALDPALTPSAVIALIREGAEASADGRRHLINPKASVALLQARGARQGGR